MFWKSIAFGLLISVKLSETAGSVLAGAIQFPDPSAVNVSEACRQPADPCLPDSSTVSAKLADPLPMEPSLEVGTLGNGLRYYIRENQEPRQRAQVWLVVNAGSILEDEDQLGLAHFVEHMAFNGTEDFARQEIIDYLESIGMKFGPEINAFTSFDETVYMLQLPTDSAGVLEKGFEILRQWAGKISFEEAEIEKERGVVIEEWRLGRGAEMRMLNQQLPVLFYGSHYSKRLPIGKVEILETFEPATLKRYYRDWYRPELMAVIAVGDFDKERVRELIRRKFSHMENSPMQRIRASYPVPDHEETLYAMATDPEASRTGISIYYKSDARAISDIGDYRELLKEQLYGRMLNLRFYELLNQAEPPYLGAHKLKSRMARTKIMHSINVGVRDGEILEALEAALTEVERVRQHGFTPSELERTRAWLLRRLERAWKEAGKTDSRRYAAEYTRHFLRDEPVPGAAFEYQAAKALLPGITLEEVNRSALGWMTEHNRVIVLSAPEDSSLAIPDTSQFESLITKIETQQLAPYEDPVAGGPLMEPPSSQAGILSEQRDTLLGTLTWELSNGIKVTLKPTDFKNDEILFRATSPGGNSLVPDEHYRSARAATEIAMLSGIGPYDLNALNRKLAGKVAAVFPFINELDEGVSGQCSPGDLETALQMIWLYMVQPRLDSAAYLSYLNRMEGLIKDRQNDPESAFYDTLMVTLANYHFRDRPWSMQLLNEIELEAARDIYTDRFSDAGDFHFVFVGSFRPDSIRSLILDYLGSLPSVGREETWKDIRMHPPEGRIQKTVCRGIEPKSRVSLHFSGNYQWSGSENHALESMVSVLRIKLREILREELGGTYSARVSASTALFPRETYRISISFGCAPERTGEMTAMVFNVIDSLKQYPVAPLYLEKVKETQRRTYETNLRRNRFWLNLLSTAIREQRIPHGVLHYPERVDQISAATIRETAIRYLDEDQYIRVVLKPEPFTQSAPAMIRK